MFCFVKMGSYQTQLFDFFQYNYYHSLRKNFKFVFNHGVFQSGGPTGEYPGPLPKHTCKIIFSIFMNQLIYVIGVTMQRAGLQLQNCGFGSHLFRGPPNLNRGIGSLRNSLILFVYITYYLICNLCYVCIYLYSKRAYRKQS